MQSGQSRFRNVFGEISKEKFDDVRPHDMPTEGSLIDVNTHYTAVIKLSWLSTGGGAVAVFESNPPRRLKGDMCLIKGHTAPVLDVKFSPFKTNLLATGSDDATIRLWEIPEGGLKEDMHEARQVFDKHSKKIGIMNFSPVAEEIIASTGFDNQLIVWNILTGGEYSKTSFNDGIYSVDWNRNGSLLGTTTKEKLIHIVDPKIGQVTLKTNAHENGKNQRMLFLKEDYVFSCGFNRQNERQVKLYDMRNFTEAVQTVSVDTQNGVMMPFFDHDTGLIFIPGRGEGNIKFYDFSDSQLKSAGVFSGNTGQKGITNFPKRVMNYNKSELFRFAKLTPTTIESLSFYFPKRNEGYDPTIYPEVFLGEPSTTLDEWLKGENKDPITKAIHTIEGTSSNLNQMNFEQNLRISNPFPSSSSNSSGLEKEVKELKEKLAISEKKVHQLSAEKDALIDELMKLRKK